MSEVQLESFAAWVLAAQIGAAALPGVGVPTIPGNNPTITYVQQDTAVTQATQLLRRIGISIDAKDIRLHHAKNLKNTQAARDYEVNAYTGKGSKLIVVTTWTKLYRDASKGDQKSIVRLAGVLAHELHHLKGHGEAASYDEELRVLTALNADNGSIQKVEKAKAYALTHGT